jgi:hypothetical protein
LSLRDLPLFSFNRWASALAQRLNEKRGMAQRLPNPAEGNHKRK